MGWLAVDPSSLRPVDPVHRREGTAARVAIVVIDNAKPQPEASLAASDAVGRARGAHINGCSFSSGALLLCVLPIKRLCVNCAVFTRRIGMSGVLWQKVSLQNVLCKPTKRRAGGAAPWRVADRGVCVKVRGKRRTVCTVYVGVLLASFSSAGGAAQHSTLDAPCLPASSNVCKAEKSSSTTCLP